MNKSILSAYCSYSSSPGRPCPEGWLILHPVAKVWPTGSLSLGFVRPMVFTDEQLQLIWWSSNSEDQWSKMLPLEIILFSIADIYYKALYSIVIFWICQKICFLLCYMLFMILPGRVRSLKYLLFALYRKNVADPCVTWAWSFERLRMRGGRFVKKVEIVWALGDGRIRAGLGVRREVWGRPGTPVPGLYGGCWTHPGARVMAAAHIYLQAVLKLSVYKLYISNIPSFIGLHS